MRAAGIVGVSRRRGVITTRRDRDARPAHDLVDRNFAADLPNQLWVADITYVPTAAGFLYLAVVLDVFSRRIVGWTMETHPHSSHLPLSPPRTVAAHLVLPPAVDPVRTMVPDQTDPNAACASSSQPHPSRCCDDHVSPPSIHRWRSAVAAGKLVCAHPWDLSVTPTTTPCARASSPLECELLARRRFTSQAEARMAVFSYIEGWYNPTRRHSGIRYLSPIACEMQMLKEPKRPKRQTVHRTGSTPILAELGCLYRSFVVINEVTEAGE
jgi:putative transposase